MLPLTLFFYGFLAAVAGLLFQAIPLILFGSETSLLAPSIGWLAGAASIEELAKLGFLGQARRRYGSTALSAVALGGFGVGFAAVEIALLPFLLSSPIEWGPVTTTMLLHMATVLALGLTLRRYPWPHPWLLGMLGLVILIHIGYNLFRLQA